MPWYRTLRPWGIGLILFSLVLDVVALATPIGTYSIDWDSVSAKAWAGYGAALSWFSGIILVAAAAIIDAICDSASDAVRTLTGGASAPAAAEPTPVSQPPAGVALVAEEPEDPEEEARRARSNGIAIVLFLAFIIAMGSFLAFALPGAGTGQRGASIQTNSIGEAAPARPTDEMVANLSDIPGAQ